jgi:signal transduction histidine kinase
VNADDRSIGRLRSRLERLSPTTHLCVPYRGREEQFALAAPFIRIGLERRERCVYVEGDVPASALLSALESLGFEAGPAVQSGALTTIPYPGPYVDDGRFDPDRMIRWFAESDDAARAAGYSAFRYIGEMTWALGPYPGVERLAEYEAKLNPFLRERPIAVLCHYDRDRFGGDVIREMLAVHPVVVARGDVCRNAHYVPPEEYLSARWPESEIDWILDSISHLQRAEDALRESEQRYRILSQQLLEVQEGERRSLALELHDQLGQILTAIRLALRSRRKGRIAEALGLVDQAAEQVRNLALTLRPASLDHLGLPAALRAYLKRQSQLAGLDIHLEVGPLEERLPPAVETACFRLVQEALTNVARHSGARRVDVELNAAEDAVEIVVRDDGKGFDVGAARERAEAGASLGILSMEERVALAGGRLEIESEPGRGTTIRARFPASRAGAERGTPAPPGP